MPRVVEFQICYPISPLFSLVKCLHVGKSSKCAKFGGGLVGTQRALIVGMNTTTFGIITGADHKPTRSQAREIAKIAKSEESTFVEINVRRNAAPGINNGAYQAWFAARNCGAPFDGDRARRVHDALIAAGLGQFTNQ